VPGCRLPGEGGLLSGARPTVRCSVPLAALPDPAPPARAGTQQPLVVRVDHVQFRFGIAARSSSKIAFSSANFSGENTGCLNRT